MDGDSKPRVCFEFEVEKVIGVSSTGNYQVQWAPSWVSKVHLLGCEHLIEEFLQQSEQQVEFQADHLPREQHRLSIINHCGDAQECRQENQDLLVKHEPHLKVGEGATEMTHSHVEENVDILAGELDGRTLLQHPNIETERNVLEREMPMSHTLHDNNTLVEEESTQPRIASFMSEPHPEIEVPGVNTNLQMSTAPSAIKVEATENTSSIIDTTLTINHEVHSYSAPNVNAGLTVDNAFSTVQLNQSQYLPNQNNESSEEPNTTTCICRVCHKTFQNRHLLKMHMWKHLNYQKRFACPHCPKKFDNNKGLITHIRVHTGERPYSCNQCNYSCKQVHHLTVHMRTHTCEKPYTCNICGRSFSQKSTLTNHMRTQHNQEKPYACCECGRSFARKDYLRKHICWSIEDSFNI